MTKVELALVMDKVVNEISFLREAGQKEYAHNDDNAFANFDRVAADLNLTRMQVLAVYARKHWDGIIAHINGHRSQREAVEGRINDMIVYLIILRGMVECERPTISRPALAHPYNIEPNFGPIKV